MAVLSTQHSALSTQHSALSTQYSVLSTTAVIAALLYRSLHGVVMHAMLALLCVDHSMITIFPASF